MEAVKVLIIDDEQRLRQLLERAVSRMGLGVSTAGSAEEAAALMREQRYDMVVLDLNLPGKSGADFLDDLRHHWPKTQVIILTGFGDLKSAQKAIRHKVADYVTKPFDLGDIERALDRAHRQLQRPCNPRGVEIEEDVRAPVGSLAHMERQLIIDALHRHEGNRTAAAEELGITRRTLYNKIDEYQLKGEF